MAKKQINFENALKELETIVSELESGTLDLNKAMEKYKRGIELSKFCDSQLKVVRSKVEKIVSDNGDLETFYEDDE